MNSVNLDKKYIDQISGILKKNLQNYSVKPYFYGSRVKGKKRKQQKIICRKILDDKVVRFISGMTQ